MIDTTNARIVFSSLNRGGEALDRAIKAARAAMQSGAITMADFEERIECARALRVQQHEAMRAWRAGYYLGA